MLSFPSGLLVAVAGAALALHRARATCDFVGLRTRLLQPGEWTSIECGEGTGLPQPGDGANPKAWATARGICEHCSAVTLHLSHGESCDLDPYDSEHDSIWSAPLLPPELPPARERAPLGAGASGTLPEASINGVACPVGTGEGGRTRCCLQVKNGMDLGSSSVHFPRAFIGTEDENAAAFRGCSYGAGVTIAGSSDSPRAVLHCTAVQSQRKLSGTIVGLRGAASVRVGLGSSQCEAFDSGSSTPDGVTGSRRRVSAGQEIALDQALGVTQGRSAACLVVDCLALGGVTSGGAGAGGGSSSSSSWANGGGGPIGSECSVRFTGAVRSILATPLPSATPAAQSQTQLSAGNPTWGISMRGYSDGAREQWVARSDAGTRVLVTCLSIGTEPGFDTVRVFDGESPRQGTLLAEWSGDSCGTGAAKAVATGKNAVSVTFEADGEVSGSFSGFSLRVERLASPSPSPRPSASPAAQLEALGQEVLVGGSAGAAPGTAANPGSGVASWQRFPVLAALPSGGDVDISVELQGLYGDPRRTWLDLVAGEKEGGGQSSLVWRRYAGAAADAVSDAANAAPFAPARAVVAGDTASLVLWQEAGAAQNASFLARVTSVATGSVGSVTSARQAGLFLAPERGANVTAAPARAGSNDWVSVGLGGVTSASRLRLLSARACCLVTDASLRVYVVATAVTGAPVLSAQGDCTSGQGTCVGLSPGSNAALAVDGPAVEVWARAQRVPAGSGVQRMAVQLEASVLDLPPPATLPTLPASRLACQCLCDFRAAGYLDLGSSSAASCGTCTRTACTQEFGSAGGYCAAPAEVEARCVAGVLGLPSPAPSPAPAGDEWAGALGTWAVTSSGVTSGSDVTSGSTCRIAGLRVSGGMQGTSSVRAAVLGVDGAKCGELLGSGDGGAAQLGLVPLAGTTANATARSYMFRRSGLSSSGDVIQLSLQAPSGGDPGDSTTTVGSLSVLNPGAAASSDTAVIITYSVVKVNGARSSGGVTSEWVGRYEPSAEPGSCRGDGSPGCCCPGAWWVSEGVTSEGDSVYFQVVESPRVNGSSGECGAHAGGLFGALTPVDAEEGGGSGAVQMEAEWRGRGAKVMRDPGRAVLEADLGPGCFFRLRHVTSAEGGEVVPTGDGGDGAGGGGGLGGAALAAAVGVPVLVLAACAGAGWWWWQGLSGGSSGGEAGRLKSLPGDPARRDRIGRASQGRADHGMGMEGLYGDVGGNGGGRDVVNPLGSVTSGKDPYDQGSAGMLA